MINISAKWAGKVQYVLHCTACFFNELFAHIKEERVLLREIQVEC